MTKEKIHESGPAEIPIYALGHRDARGVEISGPNCRAAGNPHMRVKTCGRKGGFVFSLLAGILRRVSSLQSAQLSYALGLFRSPSVQSHPFRHTVKITLIRIKLMILSVRIGYGKGSGIRIISWHLSLLVFLSLASEPALAVRQFICPDGYAWVMWPRMPYEGSIIKCENFDQYFRLLDAGDPQEAAKLLEVKRGTSKGKFRRGMRREPNPVCEETNDIEVQSL